MLQGVESVIASKGALLLVTQQYLRVTVIG